MRNKDKTKNQKGLSVIEVVMAIGALLILMPFIYSMIDSQTQKVKQMLVAQKLKELEDVLINYTIVNKDSFENVVAGGDAKDENDLYLAAYGLTLNTENMLIKYFPLRRYFIESTKYLNPNIEGCVLGTEDKCPKKLSITGFLDIDTKLFENSEGNFSFEALRKIASMAGANFGYYDGDGFVYSISGYWKKPVSDFPGIVFDPTKPKIVLLIDNSVIKEYNTFLNRLETAKNEIETYIDLGFYNLNHVNELNTGQVISKSGGTLLDGDTSYDICKCGKWVDGTNSVICSNKETAIGKLNTSDMACVTQVLYDPDNTADSGKMLVAQDTLVDNIQVLNDVSMQPQANSSITIQDYLLLRGRLELENVGNNNPMTHTNNLYSLKSTDNITLPSGGAINVEALVLSGGVVGSGEIEDKKGILNLEDAQILEELVINEAYFNSLTPASGANFDVNTTELRIDEGIDADSLSANILRVQSLQDSSGNTLVDWSNGFLTARDIDIDNSSGSTQSIKAQFNMLLQDFATTSQKTTQHICSICAKSGGRRDVIETSCQDVYPASGSASDMVYCGSMLRFYCGEPSNFGSTGLCAGGGYSFF